MSLSINDIKDAAGFFLEQLQKPGQSAEEAKDLIERAKAVSSLCNTHLAASKVQLEQAQFLAEFGALNKEHHALLRKKLLEG